MRTAAVWTSALVVFLSGTAASAQSWTWSIVDINPNQSSSDASNPNAASGGRVNGLGRAFNGTTFFAASEWGGLFRSTDSGNNWTHVDGHVPQVTWDVEVDPSNADRVYATSFYDGRVSSLAGISVSTDGGTTWMRPASATPLTGFCADAARQSEPSAFGISIDPANSAHVYIGTNCGLAISTDSGNTWNFVDPTPTDGADDIWDVVVHDGGIIDVCGDDGHQRTTDGGVTWAGAGIASGRCSLAVSPDEVNVVFWVNGTSLRESDDGGVTWSAPLTNPGPQGRIPFVVVNQRSGATFDMYFGDTQLWRAICTTPAPPNANLRCPTNSWTTVQTGAHWDVGDLVFAPGLTQDACPLLFSNDGGVYRNTLTTSPGCHTPNWEQATITTRGLWMFGMAGADQPGSGTEDLYFGNQDDGSFASTNAPDPAPTWTNADCCDAHDVAAESNRIVYTVCCFNTGRFNRVFVRNQGMTGGGELNNYPAGNVRGFSQTASIALFAANSYVFLTTNGIYITTNIGANPVAWAQLGATTTPANARDIKVATSAGTPTFYVLAGQGNGRSQDRLIRYVGTATGNNWTRVNPPGSIGGFGIFAVDPNNPNRLIASHLRTGQPPAMVRSDNGGVTWNTMTGLDNLMTGGGTFQYANVRGPASTLPTTATLGFWGYPQPTLVAFDPADANVIVAGGADSGVFITFDNGANWTLLSDPNTPGTSGRPHIPRPWYAYFDHEGSTFFQPRINLYIGTQGRGAWRISLQTRRVLVDVCQHVPGLCRPPKLDVGVVGIQCHNIKDCIVRDPIPRNCLLKYNCPGCSPGALCPPYYHLYFDGIDPQKWQVMIVTSKGDVPPQELFEGSMGVVLSFRPDKAMYREGNIGDYEIVFSLRHGAKGEDFNVGARIDVSDKPYRPMR